MNSLKDGILVLVVALLSLTIWIGTGCAVCLLLLVVFGTVGMEEKSLNVTAGLVTVAVVIGTGVLVWTTFGNFVRRRLG